MVNAVDTPAPRHSSGSGYANSISTWAVRNEKDGLIGYVTIARREDPDGATAMLTFEKITASGDTEVVDEIYVKADSMRELNGKIDSEIFRVMGNDIDVDPI